MNCFSCDSHSCNVSPKLDRVNCADSVSFILKLVSLELRNSVFVMFFSLFQKEKMPIIKIQMVSNGEKR